MIRLAVPRTRSQAAAGRQPRVRSVEECRPIDLDLFPPSQGAAAAAPALAFVPSTASSEVKEQRV